VVADGTKIRLARNLDRLRERVERTGAGLVVLDSLRHAEEAAQPGFGLASGSG